jgi:hypothetical protein
MDKENPLIYDLYCVKYPSNLFKITFDNKRGMKVWKSGRSSQGEETIDIDRTCIDHMMNIFFTTAKYKNLLILQYQYEF